MVTVEDLERARSCEDAMEEIIIKFTPMVAKLAQKYYRRNEAFEDRMQIAYLGLLKAIRNYDSDKGCSIVTYFYNSINWELGAYYDLRNKGKVEFAKNILSMDVMLDDDLNLYRYIGVYEKGYESREKREFSENLWYLIEEVEAPSLSKECLYLYYKKGLTQVDIAKKYGVTKQAVNKRIKHILKVLAKNPTIQDYRDYLRG